MQGNMYSNIVNIAFYSENFKGKCLGTSSAFKEVDASNFLKSMRYHNAILTGSMCKSLLSYLVRLFNMGLLGIILKKERLIFGNINLK